MLTVFITFVVLTTLYAVLFWLGCRRVTIHLQGNPEATKAVVDHVLIPLLGRQREVEEETGNETISEKGSE